MYYNFSQVLTIDQQVSVPRARVRVARRRKKRHFVPPLILFCALLAQLVIRIEIIERGYRLESLREQALKLDNDLRSKRLELALVTRPKTLTDAATSRLGLSPLCPQRVRHIAE
ncbi:MAG: hypothetical protein U0136_03295 [Bdellovibrionota bacterium]